MNRFNQLKNGQYPKSLVEFPCLPPPGYVMVGEADGEVHVALPESTSKPSYLQHQPYTSVFNGVIKNHVQQIQNSQETFTSTRRIPPMKLTTKESLLLPITENRLKTIWKAWMEGGFFRALENLQTSGLPSVIISGIQQAALVLNTVVNSKRILKSFLFPHLKLNNIELIELSSPICRWTSSWVRAMAWHPHFPYLAIALKDDSVNVLVNANPSRTLPILKTKQQKNVTCIAWQPYDHILVLGMEMGLIVWNLHPSPKRLSPTSEFISTAAANHSPVTSIDFSRLGHMLITSSAADTNIFVWTLCRKKYVPLHRLAGGGIPRASFSPNPDFQIFANTPMPDFRLWEFQDSCVVPSRWTTTAKTPVEAFDWHPKGKAVYFVSNNRLLTLTPTFHGEYDVKSVYDLNECYIYVEDTNREDRIGGKVLDMKWDPTGTRLVIMFANSRALAVLGTFPGHGSALLPCDFICGQIEEYPVAIAFQKDFTDASILTIAWSTERIQYFPFIFTPVNRNPIRRWDASSSLFSNKEIFVDSGTALHDASVLVTSPPKVRDDVTTPTERRRTSTQPIRLFTSPPIYN